MYDICDIHTHILPGMDDGCATVEESLAVLQKMQADGIRKVFATPHYYARESVADFLARREERAQLLLERMEGLDLPQLLCGAEVAWFPNLGICDAAPALCLGASRYMLLELPFTPWSGQVHRDVNNLCLRGITPVLAHFERYSQCQSRENIDRLLQCDVLVQMNADTLLSRWKGFGARAALKKGSVQLLGSDCHGLSHRPPRLARAIRALEKAGCFTQLEQIATLGNEIFREARK